MSNEEKNTNKVAYYPGCALEGTGHAYNRSPRRSARRWVSKLDEVDNWNCCGAMEVKNIDPKIQTYLSSRVSWGSPPTRWATTWSWPRATAAITISRRPSTIWKTIRTRKMSLIACPKRRGHSTYQAGQIETIHALDWIRGFAIGEENLKERRSRTR